MVRLKERNHSQLSHRISNTCRYPFQLTDCYPSYLLCACFMYTCFISCPGSTKAGGTAEQRVAPAGPNLKAKLMSVFTRSIVAANAFPSTLQCVFDCIYGPETTMKLKHAGMEFAVWIFKHASDDQLKPMAQIILNGLVKLLDGQNPGDTDSSSKQLRAFTYQAIGQLSLRAPHLFNKNTDMAVRMFAALRSEPDSIRVTVVESLSSLATAYKTNPDVAKEVESLLFENIKASESEARFCSVLWATRLYPFSHAPSRFICMLGVGDVKLDIREMAQQGLSAPKPENETLESSAPTADYPSLRPMMEYICQQQPQVLSKSPMGERIMLFPPKAYAAMITFVQHCYEKEQGADKSKLKGKEDVVSDTLGRTPPEEAFQLLLEHGMAIDGTADLQALASTGLLKLASFNPSQFAEIYSNRIAWLKQFIGHIDSTTREAIARLLGIAVSGLSSPQGADLLQQLLSVFHNVQKARFEDLQGSICAAGYVLAQCMTNTPAVPEPLIRNALHALFEETKNANPSLAGSAAEAIGHTGLRNPLPVTIGDLTSVATTTKSGKSTLGEATTSDPKTEVSTAKTEIQSASTQEKEELSLVSIVKQLGVLLASKDVKVQQKAAIALGHLCFGDRSIELANAALTALFTSSKSKAEDLLFSVGMYTVSDLCS
jgi:proteasome component ECM29